jgi:SAM-dependent methyltransferase
MPYQKPPNICPICKEKTNFEFIHDYKNKWGKWSLYECPECALQFWVPFKHPGEKYYEKVECVIKYGTKPNLCDHHKHFLKVHKDFPKNIKILDLGCNTGDFIAELQKKGCDVWGVDINKNVVEFAKNHFKIANVYHMSFDEFFKLPNLPKFNLITLFEVIEHLDNPLEFIQNIGKLLKDDGTVVLSTPSRERILVNTQDFPPNHLSRWNEQAIHNLFSKIGFKIIRVEYIQQLNAIFDCLRQFFKLNIGLGLKYAKLMGNKSIEYERRGIFIVKNTPLTKIVRGGALLKDYLLFGLPAIFLFLVGKITKRKNGVMLIWLKRKYD